MIERCLVNRLLALGPLAVLGLCLPFAAAQDSHQIDIESFEQVWKTVREKHWDPALGGLDWEAVHREFRPRIERAQSTAEARDLMNEMLARLGQSHFAVVPSVIYHELSDDRTEGSDYPAGIGETGIDLRVLDGRAIVTRVDPGSPADAGGIRPGWEVVEVRGRELSPVIDRVRNSYRDSSLLDLHLRRAVLARMTGDIGEKLAVEFGDGSGTPVSVSLPLSRPRGNRTEFGYLGSRFVWFETRKLEGDIGYLAFNFFLDPSRLVPEFGKAVLSCQQCAGLVIDLRGNPGGIGAMSMGMAGWLISRPDQRLGTMYMRSMPLKFVIIPRAQTYDGPLAVLVDGCSASTSEIFAGGLQDLGRARVFGTRTAGAALPSVFERLPNGDGFQYAVANYISEGGKPLEGRGVTPDAVAEPTRRALLEGHDAALDAAVAWIRKKGRSVAGEP